MAAGPERSRVEHSVVGRDLFQFGDVSGGVTLITGPEGTVRVPSQEQTDTAPPAPSALGCVRVRDADAIRLGVHRPIRVTGAESTALPAYVPRDLDTRDGDGVRPIITAAARDGGFVLLVGGSSVGKTRSLYEAIRALLPDWWLLHPADAGTVAPMLDQLPGRLVIWLDELQNHVSGTHQLTAATVRDLLARPEPVVLVGTLWPHYYDAWTATPASATGDERNRAERELLKLAETVHVSAVLSPAERGRAVALAESDGRLRLALDSQDFGLTQVIAGAPQLVHRWENADPYARAVMTAAVDATLTGVQSPVPEGLLRSAAPGYCGPAQRAGAPDGWFEEALRYATGPLLGATSALVPVSDGPGMGRPDGYRVADYVLHHTGRAQRAALPPEAFWQACAEHLTDRADVVRTGAAAAARQRLTAAVPLLRKAVEAGSVPAMRELGELYRRSGEAAGAQEMADRLTASSDPDAALYRTILAGWDFEELVGLAEAGNQYAVGHLIEYGHPRLAISLLLDDLDPDDLWSWYRLAQLFHDEDENERAIPILEMLHQRELPDALLFLAELHKEEGNIERLYELTEDGYFDAACCLADLLHDKGRTDEGIEMLWDFVDQGNGDVDFMLAHLLAKTGDVDTLLERAAEGHADAVREVARLLRDRGDVERAVAVLTSYADEGSYLGGDLAELLRVTGRLEELRARAASGDTYAVGELTRVAIEEDDVDEAVRLHALGGRTAGLFDTTRELVNALVARGETDRAVALIMGPGGDTPPYRRRDLLKRLGRTEELRALLDQGDHHALWDLVEVLRVQGRAAEADALLTRGLTADGRVLPTGPAD
ncbi:tetratricopeptide repeat protein [Streptomyces collinus]|uniref:tetratricopeptide repeat protein n=1 Tax=Streptomyces collinus TaxID=42684 RepID=UPI0036C0E62E